MLTPDETQGIVQSAVRRVKEGTCAVTASARALWVQSTSVTSVARMLFRLFSSTVVHRLVHLQPTDDLESG